MKRLTNKGNHRITSKGDRLNWTPLKEVKPVLLKTNLNTGRWLSAVDLKKVAHANNTTLNYLIP